ncbi:MAG TPA: galactosyltransferase-related protein, partial [Ruminiclostridium sp.]|nr:galactosyltransferase-related protein [Ruminiclostridium sp.]
AHRADAHNVVRGVIHDLPYLKFFKNPETGELFDSSLKSARALQLFLLRGDCIEPSLKKIRSQARLSKFEKDIHELYSITPEDHPLRWVGCTGGNISVWKKAFFHAGGFDSNMGKAWGCEDLEFGYRIKKSHGNIVMADNAESFHITHFRPDAGSEHEQAMAYFYERHKDHSINELGKYFEGGFSSLSEWKSVLEE